MKKILFHSLTIPPDNVSTGMLVAEIADGFKEMGVNVEISVSYTHLTLPTMVQV